MASPASFFLEPRGDGRGHQFRSLEALRILLDITPPYRTCLAHAPFARNAPHCSRPVNQKKAATVAGLLDTLLRTRIPSTAADVLLKTLSTCAVCGITGWHQNKAAEVQSQWRNRLWDEYLRMHGLEPRLWRGNSPPITTLGWETNLEIAWREQGYDSEDGDDEYNYGDSDADDDGSDSDESAELDDSDESDDDDDDDDHNDDDSQGLFNEGVQSSDATTSSLDVWEDGSAFDGTESWSSEDVATPNTSSSDLDESLAEETDMTPDTTTDFDQRSSDGFFTWSEEQNEGGNTDEDSFADDLLAIGSDIFSDSDEISASPPSSRGSPARIPKRHLDFRPYPQAPSPASQLMQFLNLMTQTVSHRRRFAGFIYGFARPSQPGFLKIGVVKGTVVPQRLFPDPVDHRLATWKVQCGHPVVEVFRKRIVCDAAERIESLVHLALREYRRVEDPPCRRCERRKNDAKARHAGPRSGGNHDEWFEVETQTAMRVVHLLAAFSDRLPYDKFGRLVDFWSNKAEEKKVRVGPGDTVKGWLEMIPRLAEEHTRTELDNIIGRFRTLG